MALPAKPSTCHLVSDLDGTWIPAPGQTGALRRLEAAVARIPGLVLTFATGRGFASALALLARHVRLFPHHLVTDVGTRIHHRRPEGGWEEDAAYAAWVRARWDPDLRARLAEEGLPWGVRFQPGVHAPCRIGLTVDDPGDLQQAAVDLQLRLVLRGLTGDVLASGRRELDILPEGVDKGTAVEALGRTHAPGLPLVAFGDSENDLGLLRRAHWAGLLPGCGLAPGRDGLLPGRAFPAPAPGPAGILGLLEAWGLVGQGAPA
ncbi:HAD family hydrolase [Mesoterricola sediminis]|uniref:Sucrose phosphatase-like domain-containing protein n=1 Tax=Mesoterricola sediminis TaxID=2927980 RepID=A0AA48GWS6_9BACT|nr:HAD family hydrolase [Mesoterricola sediminis]BDU77095.1 hypothetical protein METESE_20530 [Mesoterricola sediminis]